MAVTLPRRSFAGSLAAAPTQNRRVTPTAAPKQAATTQATNPTGAPTQATTTQAGGVAGGVMFQPPQPSVMLGRPPGGARNLGRPSRPFGQPVSTRLGSFTMPMQAVQVQPAQQATVAPKQAEANTALTQAMPMRVIQPQDGMQTTVQAVTNADPRKDRGPSPTDSWFDNGDGTYTDPATGKKYVQNVFSDTGWDEVPQDYVLGEGYDPFFGMSGEGAVAKYEGPITPAEEETSPEDFYRGLPGYEDRVARERKRIDAETALAALRQAGVDGMSGGFFGGAAANQESIAAARQRALQDAESQIFNDELRRIGGIADQDLTDAQFEQQMVDLLGANGVKVYANTKRLADLKRTRATMVDEAGNPIAGYEDDVAAIDAEVAGLEAENARYISEAGGVLDGDGTKPPEEAPVDPTKQIATPQDITREKAYIDGKIWEYVYQNGNRDRGPAVAWLTTVISQLMVAARGGDQRAAGILFGVFGIPNPEAGLDPEQIKRFAESYYDDSGDASWEGRNDVPSAYMGSNKEYIDQKIAEGRAAAEAAAAERPEGFDYGY